MHTFLGSSGPQHERPPRRLVPFSSPGPPRTGASLACRAVLPAPTGSGGARPPSSLAAATGGGGGGAAAPT
jgi:hypothetical protein